MKYINSNDHFIYVNRLLCAGVWTFWSASIRSVVHQKHQIFAVFVSSLLPPAQPCYKWNYLSFSCHPAAMQHSYIRNEK